MPRPHGHRGTSFQQSKWERAGPKTVRYYDYKEAKIKTCVRKSKLQGTTPRGRLGVLGEAAGADLVFCLCFSDFQILCNVVVAFIMKTINLFLKKRRERKKLLLAKGVGVTDGRSGGWEEQGEVRVSDGRH